MRFYKSERTYCCGVDLHSRDIYICIVDRSGNIFDHRKIRNQSTDVLLKILKKYEGDIVVAAESCYGWYWLSDFCEDNGFEFILGHALYMKAIHGAKVKNDRIDSHKIALLAASNMFPLAHVYSREKRALRDLLRRRLYFVGLRAELFAHVLQVSHQNNRSDIKTVKCNKSRRPDLPKEFDDPEVRRNIEMDMDMIEHYDKEIARLDWAIKSRAQGKYRKEISVLKSINGVGDIISLTFFLEIDDINRFPSHREFASYSRLVRGCHKSAGKIYASGGKKMGNAYLKRVLSEAAMLVPRHNEKFKAFLDKKVKKHGKGKARAIFAHKLGRAMFHMLKTGKVFDESRFLKN